MKIKLVDVKNYKVEMQGDPLMHQNIKWYATEDDKVLGVVLLDLVDNDYSWVVLIDIGQGFCAIDMGVSLPNVAMATEILHVAMLKELYLK